MRHTQGYRHAGLQSGLEASHESLKIISVRSYLLAVSMMLHCGVHAVHLGSRWGPADLSSLEGAGCSGRGCLPSSQDCPEWQDSPLLAPSSSTPLEELQSAKTSLWNNRNDIEYNQLSPCVWCVCLVEISSIVVFDCELALEHCCFRKKVGQAKEREKLQQWMKRTSENNLE